MEIDTAITRAIVIFSLLLLFWGGTSTSAVVLGIRTGDLQEQIIEPIKEVQRIADERLNQVVEPSFPTPTGITGQEGNKIDVKINVNTNKNGNYGAPQQVVFPTLPPVNQGQNYSDYKKQMDDWWANVQAENQRLSEQSKLDLQNFQKQSQLDMNKFKLEGQQKMEDFKIQMEQDKADFLKSHGITP